MFLKIIYVIFDFLLFIQMIQKFCSASTFTNDLSVTSRHVESK